MNTPSDNIVVLNRTHIFPSKFHMFPQGKTMNMQFSSSCKNISLCTELLSSSLSEHLNLHSVDIIEFFVDKTHHHLFETIIFMSCKEYCFMVWFVTNISHIFCSKFEKLWTFTFTTLQKLFFTTWILSHIHNCIKNFFICILTLDRIEILHQFHLLSILMLSMQIHITKSRPLLEKITTFLNNFSSLQMETYNHHNQTNQRKPPKHPTNDMIINQLKINLNIIVIDYHAEELLLLLDPPT